MCFSWLIKIGFFMYSRRSHFTFDNVASPTGYPIPSSKRFTSCQSSGFFWVWKVGTCSHWWIEVLFGGLFEDGLMTRGSEESDFKAETEDCVDWNGEEEEEEDWMDSFSVGDTRCFLITWEGGGGGVTLSWGLSWETLTDPCCSAWRETLIPVLRNLLWFAARVLEAWIETSQSRHKTARSSRQKIKATFSWKAYHSDLSETRQEKEETG